MSIKRYDSDTKELNDVAGVYRLEGGGSTIEVDDELSTVSENPVKNRVITGELNKKLTEVSAMPQNPTDKQTVLFVGETAGEYVKGTIYEYSETQSKWNAISTAEIEVDDSLDSTSENPVQNKVIVSALGAKQPIQLVSAITLESHAYDTVPTALSALATRLEDTYKKNQVDTAMNAKQPIQLVSAMILESNPYTTVPTALSALATRLENTYTKNETDLKTAGLLNPKGTVTFVNLPTLSAAEVGDMYNVSNEFTTTSDFEEGAGELIPAGANVYKTSGGKWDILSGSPVTGIKGDKEANYRRGNVNITPANIGAYSKNESDATTATIAEALDKWYIPDSFTATIDFYGYGEPSYLDATENADKNYLDQSSGWVYNAQEKTGEAGVYEWVQAVQFTATKNEKLNADKQDKTLSEPITVDGVEQTTVEDAISAINEKKIPQSDSTTVKENSALLVDNASKNLLKNILETGTTNGYNFIRNDDDTVEVYGDGSGIDCVKKINEIKLPVGLYHLSGCPGKGGNDKYFLRSRVKYSDTMYGLEINDTGNGADVISSPFGEEDAYGTGVYDANNYKPQEVVYADNIYVFVASNANYPTYWSEDGIAWTLGTGVNESLKSVVFSESIGLFVAVGSSSIYYSENGKEWNLSTDVYDNINNVICDDHGRLIVSRSSRSILISTDGINWTEQEISKEILSNDLVKKIIYKNGIYLINTRTTKKIYWSDDTINWHPADYTPASVDGIVNNMFFVDSIAYGNGCFLGYSESSKVDGTTWVWQLSRSFDGKKWDVLETIVTNSKLSPDSLSFENGKFIRSYDGSVQVSFDNGESWTSALYLDFDPMSVVFNGSYYVFVGYRYGKITKTYRVNNVEKNNFEIDIYIKSTSGKISGAKFAPMIYRDRVQNNGYEQYYKTNKQLTEDVMDLLTNIRYLMSKIGTDALKTVAQTLVGAINENADSISTLSDNKVDKVTGKVLSTNDFTDTLKTKLDGIAAGAQVNSITGVKGNSETSYRAGNVNITASNIGLGNVNNTSDADKPISTATQTALDNKVDKVTGKGLSSNDFTNTLKTKLDGIDTGANKTTVDTSMSSTSTNPVQNKVVQSALNGKVDVVSGKALSTNDFTNTLKSKLDGIASGAEVNVQADWNTTTTTDDSYIKNKPNIYLKSETYNRTEVDAKIDEETELLHGISNGNNNAATHNSIFRGKDVTSYFTDGSLYTRISSGSFDDLYVGDYFVASINGTNVNCRIAGFNLHYNNGNTSITRNHITIVPDTSFMVTGMNDSHVTTGAYAGSKMRTETIETINAWLETKFGSHLVTVREYLSNVMDENLVSAGHTGFKGASSAASWYDSKADLMTEVEVYGSTVFSSSGYDIGTGKVQYPLFALAPQFINPGRFGWWLRCVASSSGFCYVSNIGYANCSNAGHSYAVRPRWVLA